MMIRLCWVRSGRFVLLYRTRSVVSLGGWVVGERVMIWIGCDAM